MHPIRLVSASICKVPSKRSSPGLYPGNTDPIALLAYSRMISEKWCPPSSRAVPAPFPVLVPIRPCAGRTPARSLGGPRFPRSYEWILSSERIVRLLRVTFFCYVNDLPTFLSGYIQYLWRLYDREHKRYSFENKA